MSKEYWPVVLCAILTGVSIGLRYQPAVKVWLRNRRLRKYWRSGCMKNIPIVYYSPNEQEIIACPHCGSIAIRHRHSASTSFVCLNCLKGA